VEVEERMRHNKWGIKVLALEVVPMCLAILEVKLEPCVDVARHTPLALRETSPLRRGFCNKLEVSKLASPRKK
jgi:hypothetical protein